MSYLLLALPYLLQLLCIIHVLKTGRNTSWIWLIIFLPYVGGLAYLVVEVLPTLGRGGRRAIAATRDIVVRTNVAERLGLMRQAAGVLLRHRMPASVLTKSSLVVRDLDLWRGVNDAGGSILSVSLVFADDGLRRIFEPGASPVDGRMAAMLGNPKLAGFLRGVAIDRRVFDYVNLRLE